MFKKVTKILIVSALSLTLLFSFSGCKTNGVTTKKEGDKNPVVTMVVKDYGTIKIELYPDMAPNTVNNFISLVNKNFYNNLKFHRIISGFVMQGGDPLGTGVGDPGYAIKGEFTSNNFKQNTLKHEKGVISMARGQSLDSGGSQFFIMLGDTSSLDTLYAAFGKVIEGIEVVEVIGKVPVKKQSAQSQTAETPTTDVVIQSVTVDTFGVVYPEPETIKK